MVSSADLVKLEGMAALLEGRRFNFKHFMAYMKMDAVFKRFSDLGADTAVTQEDLEFGMLQLGLPTIKGIMQRSRHGWDFRDRPL